MTHFDHHKLRQLRLDSGFSQEDLAERLGMDVTTYRRYESGRVNKGPRGFEVRHVRRMNILELMASTFELASAEALLMEAPAGPSEGPGDTPEAAPARLAPDAAPAGAAQRFPRSPPAERRVDTSRLPPASGPLVGREEALGALEAAWTRPDTHLVAVVAWSGAGKTFLVQHWLARLANRGFDGVGRVLAWSFSAGPGSSPASDPFLEAALRFFDLPVSPELPAWEKARLLADHLQQAPALLILDAVEALQSPSSPSVGELHDSALALLLRRLAAWNAGLCVVTSRLPLPELGALVGHTATELRLGGLSPHEGRKLLLQLGVTGAGDALDEAVRECGGNPLLLQLLGRRLSETQTSGWVEARGAIRDLIPEGADHARVVGWVEEHLRTFEALSPEEREMLNVLALFDGPAQGPALTALLDPPAIPHLTELSCGDPSRQGQAVARLRRRLLVMPGDEARPEEVEGHPIVRQVCRQWMRRHHPGALREGHRRLSGFYAGLLHEPPRSLAAMAPAIHAIRHACLAGDWEAAWMVSSVNLHQGNTYIIDQLGATGLALECLSYAFEQPFIRLSPDLPPELGAAILLLSGRLLSAVGRCREAMPPLRQAANATAGLPRAHVLARVALAETLRLLGRLREALTEAESLITLELPDLDEDAARLARATAMGIQGITLLDLGDDEAGEARLAAAGATGEWLLSQPPTSLDAEARELAQMLLLRRVLLYEHRIDRGGEGLSEATLRRERAWAREANLLSHLLPMYQLLEGRLSLRRGGARNLAEAQALLLGEEGALAQLRRVNILTLLPKGVLAAAELHLAHPEVEGLDQTHRMLGEALTLLRGGGCLPLQADLNHGMAAVASTLASLRPERAAALEQEARGCIERVAEIREITGYGRRRRLR